MIVVPDTKGNIVFDFGFNFTKNYWIFLEPVLLYSIASRIPPGLLLRCVVSWLCVCVVVFVYLVVELVPSWKGCGRVEDGHRLFNPVALSRRSATALEQLGCQVDWWMDGLSGGPESFPQRPSKPSNMCKYGGPK